MASTDTTFRGYRKFLYFLGVNTFQNPSSVARLKWIRRAVVVLVIVLHLSVIGLALTLYQILFMPISPLRANLLNFLRVKLFHVLLTTTVLLSWKGKCLKQLFSALEQSRNITVDAGLNKRCIVKILIWDGVSWMATYLAFAIRWDLLCRIFYDRVVGRPGTTAKGPLFYFSALRTVNPLEGIEMASLGFHWILLENLRLVIRKIHSAHGTVPDGNRRWQDTILEIQDLLHIFNQVFSPLLFLTCLNQLFPLFWLLDTTRVGSYVHFSQHPDDVHAMYCLLVGFTRPLILVLSVLHSCRRLKMEMRSALKPLPAALTPQHLPTRLTEANMTECLNQLIFTLGNKRPLGLTIGCLVSLDKMTACLLLTKAVNCYGLLYGLWRNLYTY